MSQTPQTRPTPDPNFGRVRLRPTEAGHDNRRGEVRFDLGVEGGLCVLDDADDRAGQQSVVIHDVSQHGLRLSTRTPLQQGETVLVKFALPGVPARTRRVSIRWVRRVGPNTFQVGASADPPAADEAPEAPADGGYYEAEASFTDEETPEPAPRAAEAYKEVERQAPPPPEPQTVVVVTGWGHLETMAAGLVIAAAALMGIMVAWLAGRT